MTVDFGPTARDYAAYRAGFPDAFFSRLHAMGIGLPGQHVVDLGTGTGALARGFAIRRCVVASVDLAAEMPEPARRLAGLMARVRATYRVGRAEAPALAERRLGCRVRWAVLALV